MPELSRFFGIIIRMFMEVGAQHHIPHFHAYYQEEVGIFSIDPVELTLVRCQNGRNDWSKLGPNSHQQELMADWETLQNRKDTRTN